MIRELCNQFCIKIGQTAYEVMSRAAGWLAAKVGMKLVEVDDTSEVIISDVPIWRISGEVIIGDLPNALTVDFQIDVKQSNYRIAKKLAHQSLEEQYPKGRIQIMECVRVDQPQPRVRKAANTRGSGYIYLIEGEKGRFKIGLTADPKTRISTLGVKLPFDIEVIHLIHTDDMRRAERELHHQYNHRRLNGEWFDLTPDEIAAIQQIKHITYGERLQ